MRSDLSAERAFEQRQLQGACSWAPRLILAGTLSVPYGAHCDWFSRLWSKVEMRPTSATNASGNTGQQAHAVPGLTNRQFLNRRFSLPFMPNVQTWSPAIGNWTQCIDLRSKKGLWPVSLRWRCSGFLNAWILHPADSKSDLSCTAHPQWRSPFSRRVEPNRSRPLLGKR